MKKTKKISTSGGANASAPGQSETPDENVQLTQLDVIHENLQAQDPNGKTFVPKYNVNQISACFQISFQPLLNLYLCVAYQIYPFKSKKFLLCFTLKQKILRSIIFTHLQFL